MNTQVDIKTNDAVEALHSLLGLLEPIPACEWDWLEGQLEERAYRPGDKLFQTMSTDASLHYMSAGLVRYFYLTDDGGERNHTFATETNLVACLPVFIGAGTCSFNIEALEPTRTLAIPSEAVKSMENRHEYWNRLKLRLMEHVALRKEAREAEFLLYSAEERYHSFLNRHQHYAHRIPQYHIASYLGITAVALSRIRKRINPG